MATNNPYHRAAWLYEANLRLPLVAAIRRQEARAVGELLARYGDSSGRVLEIGPGTGFYTVRLADSFREVVAVEDSAPMVRILRRRLAAAGADNVTVHNADFRSLSLDGVFDVVLAIGVLDYIAAPADFVARMCAAARRAVILTAPQRAFLGSCFAAGGRMRGIRVYRHRRDTLPTWAPAWRCTVAECGLSTKLTKGMTLVAAFERE